MSENKSICWDVIEAELRKAKFELAIAKQREAKLRFSVEDRKE